MTMTDKFCPECGTAHAAGNTHCPECGHDFGDKAPVDEQPTVEQPAAAAAGADADADAATGTSADAGRPVWFWLLIGLAVLAVVGAIAGGAYYLSQQSSDEAVAQYETDVDDALEQVRDSQKDLSDALAALETDGDPAAALALIDAALEDLEDARDQLDELEAPDDDSSEQLAADTEDALDATEAYLDELKDALENPTKANKPALEKAADDARDAWDDVDGVDVPTIRNENAAIAWVTAETKRLDKASDAKKKQADADKQAEIDAAAAKAAQDAYDQGLQDGSQGQTDVPTTGNTVQCANLGEGGAGVIDIWATEISCNDGYDLIYASEGRSVWTYNGWTCEMIGSTDGGKSQQHACYPDGFTGGELTFNIINY